MKKITLIATYFGSLPWYFNYFAHSCKFNPSIDFLLITDCDLKGFKVPTNFTILHRSLEELSRTASKALKFKVVITNPYKLCDFKPTYGLLFEKEIGESDFWGHIDIDIIFGDIRSFMTDSILSTYDIISVRPDWITGCFLLFRNTNFLRTIFRGSSDYKFVFKSKKNFCFDETNFAHKQFSDGNFYFEVKTEIESMMHVIQKLQINKRINVLFELFIIEGRPGRLKWSDGRLYYKNKFEVLFYHLIEFKSERPRKLPVVPPRTFRISQHRIY